MTNDEMQAYDRITDALRAKNPDDLRAMGWSVAVHNDYKLNGASFTFWLFTKGETAVKGEGRTDAEALNVVRKRVLDMAAPYAERPAPTTAGGTTCE